MSLHELVIGSATRHGPELAVQGPSSAVSYSELDARANTFAHRLRALGVRRADRVVVWADKSPDAVAAMQAVLRLGATYVPATTAVPVGRLALMIRDCGARTVCADSARIDAMRGEFGDELPLLDITSVPTSPSAPVNERVEPDDPAYILYTSGSTGVPKGVCVSHLGARAFIDWAVTELHADYRDRFANHAPFTFDLSVLDLYAAFAVGASVHLVPTELAYAPGQLVEFLYERDISVWYSVPSALILMLRDGGLLHRPAPRRLRAVLFAGEPFPIGHVRELAAWTPARLLNLYGPTETNVCTFHEVAPDDLKRDRPVPIGRAASGDTVWAEGPDGSIVLPGEEGELVVQGPTVMLGYWGQPRPSGVHRTGDVVRVLADGHFDYVGRHDHMVKIRGNRVELGDIEAVIGAHAAVDQVAAAVEGTGLSARLVAFIVPNQGMDLSLLTVKRHCAQHLPTYMIPDEIRLVPELPRTGNGKVDRAALLRPPRPAAERRSTA
jgi:clorobiocin biosynthesis protein CloN4